MGKRVGRMMEKVTELSAPPVVGRFYLVPTVRYKWHDKLADWPVFNNRHTDAKHLDFPDVHYHIDPRFVSKALWEHAHTYWEGPLGSFQRAPLSRRGEAPPSAKVTCPLHGLQIDVATGRVVGPVKACAA